MDATADSILGSRWLFGSSLVGWLAVVVADVAISVAFYLLLRPVSHMLSLLAAALQQRQAMALAALDTFDAGFLLALVLFGVQLLMSGFLLYRSCYLPRVFGALLVAAGVGYVADSLAGLLLADHGGLVSAVLLTPAVVGELGLTAWLLLRGVKVPDR